MSISRLSGVLSKMRTKKSRKLHEFLDKFGLPDVKLTNTKSFQLPVWANCEQYSLKTLMSINPSNSFEEHIVLTDQGKLWNYPIDNEQGMQAEQAVPFENHVFHDKILEKFPENAEIRNFMEFVICGLGRNPWITADRKRKILNWHLNYFEERKELYKASGIEL